MKNLSFVFLLSLIAMPSFAQSTPIDNLDGLIQAYTGVTCQKSSSLGLRETTRIANDILEVLRTNEQVGDEIRKAKTTCLKLSQNDWKKQCVTEAVNNVLALYGSEPVSRYVQLVMQPSFLWPFLLGYDSNPIRPSGFGFEEEISQSKDIAGLTATFETRGFWVRTELLKRSKLYIRDLYCEKSTPSI